MGQCQDEEISDIPHEIAKFYVPKPLVVAWQALGGLPQHSQEAYVGMGFIDLADYTFISKFLSPKENQVLLNGLYTVFQAILYRQGGFLNKIEGDSMMFQFDGFLDPSLRNLPLDQLKAEVARKLFLTCVEIQRACNMFNVGKEMFLIGKVDGRGREALAAALRIIHSLRTSEMKQVLNAFFQIKVRLGASFGEVNIGNFGPEGYKRWDIIGMPVIEARRMESSAPVGGLRISESLYKLLSEMKITDDYYHDFLRDAKLAGSIYSDIKFDEVFRAKNVVMHEKNNAVYQTYSIQVNPDLPEVLTGQIADLLCQGDMGLERALDIVKYYRGNRLVIKGLEKYFEVHHIRIRKHDLLEIIAPSKFRSLKEEYEKQGRDFKLEISRTFTLTMIFEIIDGYLDNLGKNRINQESRVNDDSYEEIMENERARIYQNFQVSKQKTIKRKILHDVIYPLVFTSLKASLKEYQNSLQVVALVE